MKIPGRFLLPPTSVVAVVLSVLSAGGLRASGPAGVGVTGVSNGTTISGTGGVSNGPRGGGGVIANTSRSPSVATGAGPQTGVSFSNNSPHLPGVGLARGQAAGTNFPGNNLPGVRVPFPSASRVQPVYRHPSRPANAWNGDAIGAKNEAAARGSTPRQSSRPNGFPNNRVPGQHLDPTAYSANPPTNQWSSRGESRRGRYHDPYRYYGAYSYGPVDAPYFGYSGADPLYTDSISSNVAEVGPSGSVTVTPEYFDQSQDTSADREDSGPQPTTRKPGPDANSQPTVPNNGPDSLVEAVQGELIRRGYFGGKMDAMFGPDTKEALRKFQEAHHLADSGLINEATLHALQLD